MLEEESRIQDVYERRRREKGRLYSLWNSGQLFWVQELERALLDLLKENGIDSLEEKGILDIGCGSGYWIREFLELGAMPENLAGIDLLDWRIDAARQACPAKVRFERGNAEQLGFSDQSFDVIMQFTVFSSILDPNIKRKVASEMLRVLRDDGFIIWHDFFFRDPRNSDVRGVTRKEICQLFPRCQVELRRINLALPVARAVAPYSWLLCCLLERLKVFNTHYLGLIRKEPL
ncbi:class I SAM-dependent methyltransferase [Candidatus Nitrospira nitrificans]|uniref:Methyltransferase domain-containing protein n=1 Tax=Candidatus Nitrospira nitrificans TaxID=1742973 RepID=A0A0S4LAH9_9BACT|nr:class I SAM-dependent methyltransferase [Candidatus Nitrospira nitrificans]CUS34175.1 conserved hypothetical protein [Candidatus Nitrospira nitrificans]